MENSSRPMEEIADSLNMEKYVSKQVQIRRPAGMIYTVVSDFNNFTPILKDKVEDWSSDGDSCSFKVKGFTVKLRIIEKEFEKLVKITGEEGSPFEFFLWFQFKQIADNDTRMMITLHVKLNMMVKMMLGKKLETGIDEIADKIADGFNNAPL